MEKPHLNDTFQIIIDSSVSLLLTFLIIDYNSYIADGVILIGHHVHHAFLSLCIPELNDYSINLKDSIRFIIVHGYIICGYFGLSAQICLTIDIIVFLTFPTRIIYMILVSLYKLITKILDKLSLILKTAEKKWLTCRIPYYLKKT